MSQNQDKDDKFLITLSDIVNLFRRSKKVIFLCMLVLGASGAFYALTQPIKFQAEGTFREKGKKSGQLGTSILSMLGSDSAAENEAAQMIKSRKLLSDVISKLNLQGTLLPKTGGEGMFGLIKSNLSIQWAALTKNRNPVIKDLQTPLKIDYLHYDGELPLDFEILLAENGNYEVLKNRQHVGWGNVNEPFVDESLMMVLASQEEKITPQQFFLHVESLADTTKCLCNVMEVETTKNDKGVLKITFDHRDRHLACQFINTTMECYQNYLQNYHNRISQLQLNYLHTRQNYLAENLSLVMQKHANFLSDDLFNSGFVNSDKEMDFLAKNQHEYKEKLLSNELEIKRLENVQTNIYVFYDSYSQNENGGDGVVINDVLNQIRNFKQRRDGLEIEIQKKANSNSQNVQDSFDRQLNELKQVQKYLVELRDILDRFHQGIPPASDSQLISDQRFLIKGWLERIAKQSDAADKQCAIENFQFYLTNLERLFVVHEKILQERLTHQQNASGEYQGVDLKTADDLYIDYSRQLIAIESSIRQNLFFITQMEDPNFEITSLSSVLMDSVSQDMIRKASTLVLTLRDQNNQSQREQERVKDELNLQRTFLSLHLKQSVQLMELNKQLIDERVYALQNISIELIHRQISLLENTLKDYLESRLENLRQERVLIKEHLRHIRNDMSGLPKKWVAEKLIEQEVESNQLIVEEIAKMVESKNITHNLEMIQSAPIDLSIPPVHPVTPKVLLYAILGSILGGLLGSGFVLGKSVLGGLKASPENLRQQGFLVAGTLSLNENKRTHSPINDEDLEVLRRLQSYLDPASHAASQDVFKNGELLLLVEGQGPDYSEDLADLFIKKNKKLLRIFLDFDVVNAESSAGLLQYLEGSAETPSIQSTPHGDIIIPGGMSRFSTELLSSTPFRKLLEQLKTKYDWVIGVTHADAMSVEAESILPLFLNVALTITDENVEELTKFASLVKDAKRRTAFLFSNQG